MSFGASVKTLVTVAALGLGSGATAIAIGIEHDSSLFTHAAPVREGVTELLPLAVARAEAPAARPAAPARVVAIPEVQILMSTPTKHGPRKLPTRAASIPAPALDHVVPAPCVDGEYRKLEDARGVRLSCPKPE